jgi:hypothetical protein
MAIQNLCQSFEPHSSSASLILFKVVGLYIEQVCLCCLFFLKVSTQRISSIAEGVWMIVLTVITAFAQIFMYKSYARAPSFSLSIGSCPTSSLAIIRYLPMSLATKKAAQKYEKRLKRQTTRANAVDLSDNDAEELDMFRVDRKLLHSHSFVTRDCNILLDRAQEDPPTA